MNKPANKTRIARSDLIVILGFAAFWLWTDFFLYGGGLAGACGLVDDGSVSLQLVGLGTSALTAALAMFVPQATEDLLAKKAVKLSLGALLACSSVLSLMSGLSNWTTPFYAFVVLGAAAAGLIMFLWVQRCAQSAMRHGPIVLVSGSIACAGILDFVLSVLPGIIGACMAGILPLALILVAESLPYGASAGHPEEAAAPSDDYVSSKTASVMESGIGLSWRFILGLVMFSIAAGTLQFTYAPADPDVAALSTQARLFSRYTAAAVVFLGTAVFSWKPFPMFLVGSFAMIAAFLILPFLPDSQGTIASAAVNAGYTCLELMVWTVLFENARRRGESPLRLVGMGRLLMAAAAFIGVLVCTSLGFWGPAGERMAALSSTVVYILTIVTVLIVDEPRSRGSWSLIEDSFHRQTAEPGLPERCRALADSHGLTARELEVLELIAAGRSAPYIAGELGIATSTVNFHVRHVYEKLGVSSKQAAIDLVESASK